MKQKQTYESVGINTDISCPTIMTKRYKITEEGSFHSIGSSDKKDKEGSKGSLVRVKPMLVDAEIIDSIIDERAQQDNPNAYQEFNDRLRKLEGAQIDELDEEDEEEKDEAEPNYEEPGKMLSIPHKNPPPSNPQSKKKSIRMLG